MTDHHVTPDGWFPFGSFAGFGWLPTEASSEVGEDGLPLWERPVQLTEVTRVTVVGDAEGRVFERKSLYSNGVRLSVQDDGRTLKVLPKY